ncbi:protease inhibitor I42 family protein [Dehalogenimonas sp. 4OHTPN]|uniref:Protease inhibitor I42 family protein n=1 Tax=Dehalogenimonas sp. 4OHTPN TaxID=3166643 RepID=A0AAU8GCK7_9CHLR
MGKSLKNKSLLWGLMPLLILTMVLGGCAAPNAEAANEPEITDNNPPVVPPLDDRTTSVQIELTYDELLSQKHIVRDVTVAKPGSVIVTLASNPSTGFSWAEAVIGDGALLSQYSRQFVEPSLMMPGAAGKDVWTFKTLAAGVTTIKFEYSQSWQGGQQDAWTLTLNITVN